MSDTPFNQLESVTFTDIEFDDSKTLEDIDAKLNLLLSEVNTLKTLVNDIIPEVKPLVDSLMNSPIIKMLGGKVKK